MAKRKKTDSDTTQEESHMKLFYIFYSQERWDNWITALKEADAVGGMDDDEIPQSIQTLGNFNLDICIEVLKIIKLYQNSRFSKEEALTRIKDVEKIVLKQDTPKELADLVAPLQFSLLVLFASTKRFLDGGFDDEIKNLVKQGRGIKEEKTDDILEIAGKVGANVIAGKSCCGRFIKESDDPSVLDEWLIEVETMAEALNSLKNFDEEAGETK